MRDENIAPRVLNFGIGCEWSASRPGCFTLLKKSLLYPLYRKLDGPLDIKNMNYFYTRLCRYWTNIFDSGWLWTNIKNRSLSRTI